MIPKVKANLCHQPCNKIILSTTNKMQHNAIFFIVVDALHVSGGFSALLPELKNCTHSIWYVSGLLLLPLVWLGWNYSAKELMEHKTSIFEVSNGNYAGPSSRAV
jgi:hypothetical protein